MKKWGFILLCLSTLLFDTNVSNGGVIEKKDGEKIVYCDGVYDMAHYGHAKSFAKARKCAAEFFKIDESKVKVLVGVCDNDGNLKAYKREPIFDLPQRVAQVLSFKGVDGVIPNAPMAITDEFIDQEGIDLVVHGDDFDQDKILKYYKVAAQRGMFKTFPYEPGISTSHMIKRAGESSLNDLLGKSDLSVEERQSIEKSLDILKRK